MISLFLDTSYHNLIISIFEGKKEIYHLEEESNNDLSIRLLPAIEEAFESLKIDIRYLKKIFVVNGPGSFTGVRICVTAAKTLAWALDIEIVTVSEIELLATTKADKKYVAPLIDARRNAVYAGLYNDELNSLLKDRYIDRKEFIEMIQRKVKMENVCFVSYDKFDDVEVITPKIDVSKIIEKHIKDSGIDPHIVIPNYLKKTEAEEKLNK